MTDIRIGDLSSRVVLEAAVATGDGGGGSDVTWQPVEEIWAAVRPVTGREALEAEALTGRVSHEIWCRYRPGVTPAMRVTLGARVFDIRSVLNVAEEDRFLRLSCEERIG